MFWMPRHVVGSLTRTKQSSHIIGSPPSQTHTTRILVFIQKETMLMYSTEEQKEILKLYTQPWLDGVTAAMVQVAPTVTIISVRDQKTWLLESEHK